MSEEEAIKILKNETDYICEDKDKAINVILNLYNKEKEKNKRIKNGILFVGRRNGKSNELNIVLKEYISKEKIKKLKEKVHDSLDGNGITRAYQLEIDRYFDEILEE